MIRFLHFQAFYDKMSAKYGDEWPHSRNGRENSNEVAQIHRMTLEKIIHLSTATVLVVVIKLKR